MLPTHFTASVIGALLVPGLVLADLEALWLEPSSRWYGIDGNWSSMSLSVGEPAQQVDVTVSTSLSEVWVVESSGCSSSALCTAARGNVFNISASTSWSPLGAWQLGLEYLGLGGNGDYAMDTVAVYNSVTRLQTPFQKQVVAGINDTGYYTGFFGLGITPGRFNSVVEQSPIDVLVEQSEIIPSHTYGYTAGAYYGGPYGTPLSLTLGGYDQNRFVAHGTSFSLNSTTQQPQALIRGIAASVTGVDKAPTVWSSSSRPLLSFNESVSALIDSATPYLWLPTTICDRFAAALNLTWNETFGLYTFASNSIFDSFSQPDLSFTFTLSSTDNRDNYGQPLNTPGVVNITISANAFAQTLRYPFMDMIEYSDAAVPYFPLRRAEGGSQIIIGRSFLQEAYIVTNYETSTFSIHQALFPDNPLMNTSIVTIGAGDNNNNSSNSGTTTTSGARGTEVGLTKDQIIGVVVGACVGGMAIILMVWWTCRRKNKGRARGGEVEMKDTDSSTESGPTRSSVARFISLFTRKAAARKAKKGNDHEAHEVAGTSIGPVEIGAEEHHTRYELPVLMEPVELDGNDAGSINSTTEVGTEDTHELSAYEMARRKLNRRLQGPVPEYTPSASPIEHPSAKGYRDMSPVAHYRPSDCLEHHKPSPASTPTYESFTHALPSPMTPHTTHSDWLSRIPDMPSPMAYNMPTDIIPRSISISSTTYSSPSPNTFDYRSMSGSASTSASPVSPNYPTGLLMPLKPPTQRTTIDSSKVVCLGPLQNNVRLAHRSSIPPIIWPDGNKFAMPTTRTAEGSRRELGVETFGSNYTVNEDARDTGEMASRILDGPSPIDGANFPTESRIDGADLVHVPQPAEKRFSWEDGR